MVKKDQKVPPSWVVKYDKKNDHVAKLGLIFEFKKSKKKNAVWAKMLIGLSFSLTEIPVDLRELGKNWEKGEAINTYTLTVEKDNIKELRRHWAVTYSEINES